MRTDKFTNRMQAALVDAQSKALARDHSQIEPLHLLLALLESKEPVTNAVLSRAGGDLSALQNLTQAKVDALPTMGQPSGEIGISGALARILARAEQNATQTGDQFIAVDCV